MKKLLHQIWVGPKSEPKKWTDTWKRLMPEWEYILWDNQKLKETKWENEKHIKRYLKKKQYHGVADLMRLEILYNYGGFIPAADWECLKDWTNLLEVDLMAMECQIREEDKKDWKDLYNREEKGKFISKEFTQSITPIISAKKGHPILKKMIDKLKAEKHLGKPCIYTGNIFTTKIVKENEVKIKTLPIHYFIGEHHTGYVYKGKGERYANSYWGTTLNRYKEGQYGNKTLTGYKLKEYLDRKKWTGNMDIVYIVDGKEKNLKYSIRSIVENLPHRKLVIVGKKGKLKPDIHIKANDTGNKISNVAKKLVKVCKDKRVSKNFILMQDDIFIMEKYNLTPYYTGMLYRTIRKRKGFIMNEYTKAGIETLRRIGKQAVDYSAHAPIEINKKKLLKLEDKYKITEGKYLTRTLYGNEYKIGGKKSPQIKTKDYIRNGLKIISTGEREDKDFNQFIKDKFKIKSKYEK